MFTRKEAIENGLLLECLPVIIHAKLEIACDSCAFTWSLFEKRIRGGAGTEYENTVDLLRLFLDAAKQAPVGSTFVEFTVAPIVEYGKKQGDKWICRVTSTNDPETNARCLTFTEKLT